MSDWELGTTIIPDPHYGHYTTLTLRAAGEPFGYEIHLILFGGAQIILTDGESVADCWFYEGSTQALEALTAFNPDTMREPDGWYRNPPTGRRRRGGDKRLEIIAF